MDITDLSILGGGILMILAPLAIFLSRKIASLRDPVKVWHALNKPIIRKFRPFIYSYLLSFANPFSSCIHMRITTLDKGFCSGVLKEQKRIHNPFNSIHAAALCTFAETIGGLAVFSKLTDKDRAIVTRINMEYFKKARGLITATSQFNLGEISGQTEKECEVILKNEALDTVAKATVFWSINSKN
ncbi:hypothetical protein RhiirA5_422048 [Rhizophagus irregularis]|uniref:DUF4442 domain-containing protein n=2 Tax=Rhizophagus irregularis TaxID=588596 RepID=A0A2I1ENX4_9GLOM|nr:hypothetical protein RirG_015090 [Rhizophagus irregularis DAOM 197198w]PKC04568.1 hypothetical protein RhiirA5_422048 [Rhizophagus irregularis]GBC13017.1 DUF4442 domain-containing protein [Rhizophagus irregularis DAOM 181602=DAOM 197198]PKC59568.1 hypothetical protein RhiirA1_426817 [Rhizophagus irregularis]PKK64220.1 hypothetical protein RhiirC2_110223 [Rhizophagus irregularis]